MLMASMWDMLAYKRARSQKARDAQPPSGAETGELRKVTCGPSGLIFRTAMRSNEVAGSAKRSAATCATSKTQR
jgi:hypothetical protein